MPTNGDISLPFNGLIVPSSLQVTTPARVFNVAFTPSATRPVLGLYTCSIQATAALGLLASDDGRIELRAQPGAPVIPRASMRNRCAQLIGLLTTPETIVETELSFLFPPGWQGMLATVVLVAAPVFTLVRQTEIIL